MRAQSMALFFVYVWRRCFNVLLYRVVDDFWKTNRLLKKINMIVHDNIYSEVEINPSDPNMRNPRKRMSELQKMVMYQSKHILGSSLLVMLMRKFFPTVIFTCFRVGAKFTYWPNDLDDSSRTGTQRNFSLFVQK